MPFGPVLKIKDTSKYFLRLKMAPIDRSCSNATLQTTKLCLVARAVPLGRGCPQLLVHAQGGAAVVTKILTKIDSLTKLREQNVHRHQSFEYFHSQNYGGRKQSCLGCHRTAHLQFLIGSKCTTRLSIARAREAVQGGIVVISRRVSPGRPHWHHPHSGRLPPAFPHLGRYPIFSPARGR